MRSRILGAVAVFVAGGMLAACSTGDGDVAESGGNTPSPAEVAQTGNENEPSAAEQSPDASLSDIERAVAIYTDAFDALGLEYTEPERTEAPMSGAVANFYVTINGNGAGILVFDDEEILKSWQGVSDTLGGVHVATGLYVLSLDSSDSIAKSVELAPLIAAAVGGEARGV